MTLTCWQERWKTNGGCTLCVDGGTGTSGSCVCCSSFCFRDVQGLNGSISRVCMSLPIPSINRLLLLPNEGNVNSYFVLMRQAFYPGCLELNFTVKSAFICTNSVSPPQSASLSPDSVRPAAASQTNPAPCFKIAWRLTCYYPVATIF